MSLEYDLFVKIFKICFAHFLFFPTVVILRSYLATRSWNVVRSLFFVVCRSLFVGELEILAERKYLFLYLNFTDDMENDKDRLFRTDINTNLVLTRIYVSWVSGPSRVPTCTA